MLVWNVQFGAGPDKDENKSRLASLLEQALKAYQSPDLIVLPELWLAAPTRQNVKALAETRERYLDRIVPIARKMGATIVAGTYPELADDGHIYNACLVVDGSGKVIATYYKRRLFNALGRNEAEVMSPGPDQSVIFHVKGIPVGLLICYELRFSDLAYDLVRLGAQVIAAPSAFYSPRHDHWMTLSEGTALHNLCYVVASNQIGHRTDPARDFCGRSVIVDPWGIAIATASDKECVIAAELDFAYLQNVRERVASVHPVTAPGSR